MANLCKRCAANSGDYNLCKDCWREIQEQLDTNISSSTCKLCGKKSGGYPLCWDCRENFDNGTFLACIKCGRFKKDERKLCGQCEEKSKTDNINIIKQKQIELQSSKTRDYRKKYPSNFRTQDGHYVRSRGEVMIADFLFKNKIRFIYEKRVSKNGEEFYPDFFLPDQGIYIEYWGSEEKDYQNLKQKKKDFYRKNKYILVELSNDDFHNLSDQLERELENKGVNLNWE